VLIAYAFAQILKCCAWLSRVKVFFQTYLQITAILDGGSLDAETRQFLNLLLQLLRAVATNNAMTKV
jgi:hypothetical protein